MSENPELSDRELEILGLVATGASNKEIAQRLAISTNTVKVHLRNVFAKTGVVSRTEATLYAIREGLVHVDSPAGVAEPALTPVSGEPSVAMPVPMPKTRSLPRVWVLVALGILLVALLIAGFFAATSKPTTVASASPVSPTAAPRWQARAPMSTARSGAAATTYENQIYVLGGETADGISGLVERYDPATDAWTPLAAKPTAVADANAAMIGGRIYVPGGRLDSGNSAISDRFEVYDPRQDKWDERAKLPEPISAYALAALEGKLYLFGGWNGKRFLDSAYEYDPDRDTWRTLTPLSRPRAYAGAAVVGSRIFLVGGYDGKDALSSNDVYQPEREARGDPSWTSSARLPVGRYGMGVVSISDILYLVGGVSDGKTALPPLEYIQQNDNWLQFESPFSENWANLSLVTQGTYIRGIGGKTDGILSDRNMAYQALYTVIIPIIR